jgi:hypothetical protein
MIVTATVIDIVTVAFTVTATEGQKHPVNNPRNLVACWCQKSNQPEREVNC